MKMNDLVGMSVLAFILYLTSRGIGSDQGQEINWQVFKTQLLASGEVERLVVINKTTAQVILRGDAMLSGADSQGRLHRSSRGSQPHTYSENIGQSIGDADPYYSGDRNEGHFDTGRAGAGSGLGAGAYGDNKSAGQGNPRKPYPGPRLGEAIGSAKYFFTIGSIESFERKLEIAQRELGIDTHEFIPVQYVNQTSWGSELMKFAPTLLIVGFWLLMMRGMAGGAGPGGGRMGDIFKIGRHRCQYSSHLQAHRC